MRGERRLYDGGLGHPFAGGVIGKPAGEIGRQPEGMPRTQRGSKPHVVGGIEPGLTRDGAHLTLHRAKPLRIVVRLVVQRLELLHSLARLGRDLLVLGQFRFAADPGIRRILCGTGRRRDDGIRQSWALVGGERLADLEWRALENSVILSRAASCRVGRPYADPRPR
jgi:hypothetical protein